MKVFFQLPKRRTKASVPSSFRPARMEENEKRVHGRTRGSSSTRSGQNPPRSTLPSFINDHPPSDKTTRATARIAEVKTMSAEGQRSDTPRPRNRSRQPGLAIRETSSPPVGSIHEDEPGLRSPDCGPICNRCRMPPEKVRGWSSTRSVVDLDSLASHSIAAPANIAVVPGLPSAISRSADILARRDDTGQLRSPCDRVLVHDSPVGCAFRWRRSASAIL